MQIWVQYASHKSQHGLKNVSAPSPAHPLLIPATPRTHRNSSLSCLSTVHHCGFARSKSQARVMQPNWFRPERTSDDNKERYRPSHILQHGHMFDGVSEPSLQLHGGRKDLPKIGLNLPLQPPNATTKKRVELFTSPVPRSWVTRRSRNWRNPNSLRIST